MLKKSVLISLGAGVALLVAVLQVPQPRAEAKVEGAIEAKREESSASRALVVQADASARTRQAAEAPESVVAGADAVGAASVDSSSERDRALKDAALRDLSIAVELSLSDQVDTVAILASTLELLRGATGVEGPPTTIPTGALCYAIRGEDPSVQAELRITPTIKPDQRSLSVRLKMPAPVDQYFVQGALREPPEVELMMVPGADGKLSGLIIHTSLMVAPESLSFGVPLSDGRYIQGINYWMNTLDATDAVVRAHGMVDGRGDYWTPSVAVVGDWQSQMAHVQELSRLLLDMYDKTKS